MNDKQLYARLLGISTPWKVTNITLALDDGKVDVHVSAGPGAMECPDCGKRCPGYDHRERRWRHLDTCQYQTILVAKVPRIKCAKHGIKQIQVPWAVPGGRFTVLQESLVINWLREASKSGVAEMVNLTWEQVDGIMRRAVKRGLARRDLRLPTRIGVDETSFQKRHEYVTVVSDLSNGGHVLHVEDRHDKKALAAFYTQFTPKELGSLEYVAMDMGRAFIAATRQCVPDADEKIAFDRFHVVKMLNGALDTVRKRENRSLMMEGDRTLVGTRYLWLQSPFAMTAERWATFDALRESSLKTARAYAIKDTADSLWRPRHPSDIEDDWEKWYAWAIRSRLDPIKKVARTVKTHLRGIVNAITAGISNAKAEGLNSVIQKLKRRACGYRSRTSFKNAIYFHLGGLDLYPRAADS